MGGIKACIRLPLPFLPSGNSTERSFLKVQPCRLLMSCKLEAGQGRRCGFLELGSSSRDSTRVRSGAHGAEPYAAPPPGARK